MGGTGGEGGPCVRHARGGEEHRSGTMGVLGCQGLLVLIALGAGVVRGRWRATGGQPQPLLPQLLPRSSCAAILVHMRAPSHGAVRVCAVRSGYGLFLLSYWLTGMWLFGHFSLSHTFMPVVEDGDHKNWVGGVRGWGGCRALPTCCLTLCVVVRSGCDVWWALGGRGTGRVRRGGRVRQVAAVGWR